MAVLNSKTQLVGHITSNNLPINVQIVATGAQGKQGKQGEPGRTPEILAIQEEDGITITVDGKAIATIKDGKDGKDGRDGVDGTVSFDELTPEQRESLRGEQGIQGEQGKKGDPFRYEDFTPEQLEYLKGDKGADGITPVKGVDYFTDSEIVAIEDAAASKVVVPTKVSELENDSGFATSNDVPTIFQSSVTIPSGGWSGADAPYINEVTVDGLRSSDAPIVDMVVSNGYETAEAQIDAYGVIYRMVADTNKLTVYATDVPEVDIPIQIMAVRE